MSILADDPTALAVLAAVPCYPVPPTGASPAIDALRASRSGHGLAVGSDGVMLILRRPWLELDVPLHPRPDIYLPYGSIGDQRANLVCGLIPAEHYHRILAHLRAALPDEAAAFVLWNEHSGDFDLVFPVIDEATPSRLVYRPPASDPGWHVVCDIHSHGRGGAFFSTPDNEDDAHSTKISVVFGRLDRPTPDAVARICAAGMFLPLPRIPFAGGHHAA
jgi:PRTRC genetic system protein A